MSAFKRPEDKRRSVFTRRALLLGGGQLAVFGFLSAKLYRVQIIEGERYVTLAENNRVSTRLTAPARGRILDRHGGVVAGNQLNWRALLTAEETDDVDRTLDEFARITPLAEHERARIARDLRRNRRFIPVTVRDDLSWEDMARIEVAALDLPGIMIDVGTTRLYAQGPALAHVVGYVAAPNESEADDDPMLALPGIRIGRSGMERAQDVALRGRAGAVQMEVNAHGRVIRELDRQAGTPGQDLGLTIDVALQQSALRTLGDESASAVVLDARNGEVLAMTTAPSFDPGLFSAGVSQKQWGEWVRDPRAPLINKAVAGLYAPGSTFKMAVAAAGLEAGAVAPQDRFFCPGHLDIGNTRFHCWRKGGHGSVNLRAALKHSCDVYFYEVARRTGIDRIAAAARAFGLGVDLGIELPDARDGLMPTLAWQRKRGKPWNLGDTISCGIGQGYIQTTPLALAAYTARLATGRAVSPHLTRAIGGVAQKGASADDWPPLAIPDKTLQILREGMWAVVNEAGGTATIARIPGSGAQMAGKTGSSQVRRVSREQRERGFKSENLPWKHRPHALFVCYAPYDAPRYAVAVVVEHGNAGSAAAAPLGRDIMAAALARDAAPQRIAERT